MHYGIAYLGTRSTLLPLVVLIYPLVVLICPLVVLVYSLVILVFQLVVLVCPFVCLLVVLVVLSVGLFITDPYNDNKMIILMSIIYKSAEYHLVQTASGIYVHSVFT